MDKKGNEWGTDIYDVKGTKKMSAAQFNDGNCYWFAGAVERKDPSFKLITTSDVRKQLVERSEYLKNVADHAFVEKDGKFYDIEKPNGVSHPADLPFYQRKIAKKISKLEVKNK